MYTLVTDRITKLSMDGGLHALNEGHRITMGQPFQLAWAMACMGGQLCLECGNFQKAHCNNWQNQKIPHGYEGTACTFKCDELFDPQTARRAVAFGNAVDTGPWKGGPLHRVVLLAGHPWAIFKAFEDEEVNGLIREGAFLGTGEYVRLIACEDRYHDAWHEAVMGRPAGFSHALHDAGYYTADKDVYTRGLVSIANTIYDPCERIVRGEPHGIDDGLRSLVLAQVTETLREFGRSPDNHDLQDFDAVA